MNIPDMDFTRIRSVGHSGQRGGFEQFICEQVAQESPEAAAKFVSLHGDGGDGGVECYWTLSGGDQHGHQAKYWTTPAQAASGKAQLDKSVKAALEQHPKLTKYTIAIPTDPTGPTGGPGKSLLQKIHDPGGWLDALPGGFKTELVESAERSQVGAGETCRRHSVVHVEVFRMDGVGTSIVGRPRPLSSHRRASNCSDVRYTLNCEEPVNPSFPAG